jgi:hypothetical protein
MTSVPVAAAIDTDDDDDDIPDAIAVYEPEWSNLRHIKYLFDPLIHYVK